MKAEELMIGDWLKCEFDQFYEGHIDVPCRVYAIKTDWDTFELRGVDVVSQGMESVIFAEPDMLHPIPLTPEILEKNGFYFGYTSNAEDLSTAIGASIGEPEHWCYDDGGESVEVLYPNDSDCGEVRVFNGDTLFSCFQFEGTIYLHELQHFLRLSKSEKEIKL